MPTKKKTPARKPVKKAAGLSGYLVVWRHNMDDVPVGLFANKADAVKAAETMSFRAAYAVARKLEIDCSTPVCFVVIGFENGAPSEMIYVGREDDA